MACRAAEAKWLLVELMMDPALNEGRLRTSNGCVLLEALRRRLRLMPRWLAGSSASRSISPLPRARTPVLAAGRGAGVAGTMRPRPCRKA